MQLTLILFPIALAIYGAIIYLFVLLVKALRKYIKSKDVREEKKAVCRSLGEALKTHRTEKQMTQEFVAETLGVSRQAVSKWENGTSDPSTSNLCALAKLYGIPVEELLHETQDEKSEDRSKKETAVRLSLFIMYVIFPRRVRRRACSKRRCRAAQDFSGSARRDPWP